MGFVGCVVWQKITCKQFLNFYNNDNIYHFNIKNMTTLPKNMSKEVLEELKKIAKMVWVSLKDLIFWNWENIVVLKNEAEKSNVKKLFSEQNITMESVVENWAMRTIVRVPDNYESKAPIHFCFILDTKWVKQAVQPTWYIWKNAKVKIFAYCFGVEYDVLHWDWKKYYLDEGASLEIYEFNYNWEESYLKVYNTFYAELKDNAYFKNYYVSTVGHLGHWTTRGHVKCIWKNSRAEFITKNRILDKDISDLDIKFELIWENTSGLIQSKSVTYEWGTNKFIGQIVWKWDNAKGHIECDEVSMWNCVISTSPTLLVENPTARLTHEAAVWSVEKKAIENLMVKGFTEDEAIEFIVKGVLD